MADLRAQIMAIQADPTLSDAEKAKKRQELMTMRFMKFAPKDEEDEGKENGGPAGGSEPATAAAEPEGTSKAVDEHLKCAMCMDVCTMPVTAACQHNFCLKCLNKWIRSGKKNCVLCRTPFSRDFINNPRINTTLVALIREAKSGGTSAAAARREKERLELEKNRPDHAKATSRAKKTGLANAASGRLMVTCPTDTFGPIGPEYDPEKGRGLRVCDNWPNRLDCRQYGAHFPHVAGIAGQSDRGAQSVVLSGGYEDDQDHGNWFLYTGSGGRDLSGNKRTNKVHDFDQEFTKFNAALKTSCELGLPLRVVRSHKEKKSAHAPDPANPMVRYDGIYRIEKCWRKRGLNQPKLMCRYLIVRCDNEPAPWSDLDQGDTPQSLESCLGARIRELDGLPEDQKLGAGRGIKCVCAYCVREEGKIKDKGKLSKKEREKMEMDLRKLEEWYDAPVVDYFDRSKTDTKPAWDWLPDKKCWGWTCEPPKTGQTQGDKKSAEERDREQFLKQYVCCHKKGKKTHILKDPVTLPCGHHFCRICLEGLFKGSGTDVARSSGRSLRVKKVVKVCPCKGCNQDVTECVNSMQVDRGMGEVLKERMAKLGLEYEPWQLGQKASGSVEGAVKEDASAAQNGVAEEEKEQKPIDVLADQFPGVDRGLIEMLLADQDGDVKDVTVILRKMTSQPSSKKQKTKA